MAATPSPSAAPRLEDFEWRTSVTLATSELDDLGAPVPLCRLAMRLANGTTRELELTAEQLDETIEALAMVEKATTKALEQQTAQ